MQDQAERELTDERVNTIAGGKNKGQPSGVPTNSTTTKASSVMTTSTTTKTSIANTSADVIAETSVMVVLT